MYFNCLWLLKINLMAGGGGGGGYYISYFNLSQIY